MPHDPPAGSRSGEWELSRLSNNALHTVAGRAGVKLIPAHTVLLGLAREHGCAYESL